ncbi:plasmid stabilization protein [Rhizobium sp. TRM96647]|uniref:FitA-like ribbon-helix-helix domain-containing protein n=1 Tax=unclassified Rhizobium TaxID=2613769 RepID=UPI0021E925E1|nr:MULTISPECIES: plasmid stabilization protein [unclassified Rhizobium]MCV3736487.1 plasmid stabilization protein [Rhizobium sp. TRM96647]MCV3758856.1 plasmid stabilization protein [Rhizobium sp. TRM96650]
MGDLLLRNIDGALKDKLQASARKHGRSLSQEAVAQLRTALNANVDGDGRSAGERLRAVIGDTFFSEEELREIEAFRKAPDREPPSFD